MSRPLDIALSALFPTTRRPAQAGNLLSLPFGGPEEAGLTIWIFRAKLVIVVLVYVMPDNGGSRATHEGRVVN